MLKTEVTHLRADHASVQFIPPLALTGNNKEHLVAIDNFALVVHHDHPIAVTVESNADVGPLRHHLGFKRLRFGCPILVINVKTVRRRTDRNDRSPELVENLGGNVVGGAVSAIDDDFESVEIMAETKGALAEFDIAARGIDHAMRLA
jgi:hypothetical protein